MRTSDTRQRSSASVVTGIFFVAATASAIVGQILYTPLLKDPDFLAEGADAQVKEWLGGKADVVMSDMAAASSGHKGTDHLRIIALCEAAAEFAFDVLEEGGCFVAKVLAGGAEQQLQLTLKRNFRKVANVKPKASRADSSEKFVVAQGFRGRMDTEPAEDEDQD